MLFARYFDIERAEPAEVVLQRLQTHTRRYGISTILSGCHYIGEVSPPSFSIREDVGKGQVFHPMIEGYVEPLPSGSRIRARLRPVVGNYILMALIVLPTLAQVGQSLIYPAMLPPIQTVAPAVGLSLLLCGGVLGLIALSSIGARSTLAKLTVPPAS